MSFSASRLLHERTADAISRASRSMAGRPGPRRDSRAAAQVSARCLARGCHVPAPSAPTGPRSSDTVTNKLRYTNNETKQHPAPFCFSRRAPTRSRAAFVVHKGLFPQPAILLCACAQRQLLASRSSIGSAARPPARGPVHPVRSHLHRVHLAAYRLRVPALFGRET